MEKLIYNGPASPMIYSVKKDKEGTYCLEPSLDVFKIPKKVYGNVNMLVTRFWRSYISSDTSMGVMLTGAPGSGKTGLSSILANKAIENGLAVVIVSDIRADIELVHFINNLSNMVIMFDEFAKVFDHKLQEMMLTMFSGITGGKKLYLLTENNTGSISIFIRNRPGRVRYHIEFGRVPEDVLHEYCADHDMVQLFLEELIEKYNESIVFSFDHLQALVSEHLEYPNDSFQDVLDVLNLEIISKTKMIQLISVTNIITEKEDEKNVKWEHTDEVEKRNFDNGHEIYIGLSGFDSIRVGIKHVVSIDGDKIMCMVKNKYKILLSVN